MATSLQHRPILHATSVIIIIILTVSLIYTVFPGISRLFPHLPWLLMAAWFSHHIRDAQRRGLWFPPFGSTPKIPYYMFLIITFLLPIVLKILLTNFAMLLDDNFVKQSTDYDEEMQTVWKLFSLKFFLHVLKNNENAPAFTHPPHRNVANYCFTLLLPIVLKMLLTKSALLLGDKHSTDYDKEIQTVIQLFSLKSTCMFLIITKMP